MWRKNWMDEGCCDIWFSYIADFCIQNMKGSSRIQDSLFIKCIISCRKFAFFGKFHIYDFWRQELFIFLFFSCCKMPWTIFFLQCYFHTSICFRKNYFFWCCLYLYRNCQYADRRQYTDQSSCFSLLYLFHLLLPSYFPISIPKLQSPNPCLYKCILPENATCGSS